MVKNNIDNFKDNKKSIYYELKEYHDTNPGVLYSYQDFETAGLAEYKSIANKLRPLLNHEKNRLANELVERILREMDHDRIQINLSAYLKLNPVINYYDSFIRHFGDILDANNDMNLKIKLKNVINNIVLKSSNSEEVKLGILMAAVCKVDKIEEILEVFSIHNDYLFYVIKAYEYIRHSNNIIFEIAKKSYGYGKVFCVMNLRPVTYNIRRWMIENGCNNNVGILELLSYCLLSIDIFEYLENTKFSSNELEAFAKSFSMLLSDYGIDEIKDSVKVCKKFLEITNEVNGGIYSLYAVISIMYSIEAIIIDEYKNDKASNSYKFNNEYKEVIGTCTEICSKVTWHEIIANEVSNIEIESSVLISCSEKTKYKLKKIEFEKILKRDFTNVLLYKYAFTVGNKAIKKCALDLGLKKLPMDRILRGQDELKIENLTYDDIAQICFYIIIKYAKYEEFKEQYKELNLQGLKSPLIETRIQAAANLQSFKEEFDELDKEIISDAISSEMVMTVRRSLNSLLIKDSHKAKKYVEVDDNMHIDPHVKDVYLITLRSAETSLIDMSEVYNKIHEDDIVYLIRELSNLDDQNSIEIITTFGYVIGYVPKEANIILKNLLDKGKYLYGKIKEINEDYNNINIKVYLSYKDVIEEITSTLSLLSGDKECYVQ